MLFTALSLLTLVLLCAQSSLGEPTTTRKTCRARDEHCGWELMEDYGSFMLIFFYSPFLFL